MKRLLIGLALILACTSASAQMLRSSDVLVTDDGTLFSIGTMSPQAYNTQYPDSQLDTKSSTILRLRIHNDGKNVAVVVPETLNGGLNVEPSLAYDTIDNRLYVFWQRIPTITSSELLFASYKDGVWTNATVFDTGIWRYRFNLKVAITRYVDHTNEDGVKVSVPMMIAHAIWWEQAGNRESARYAMMELEQGLVRSVQISDLSAFVKSANPEQYILPEDYDRNAFRTPFVFEFPTSDAVQVLFANWDTNRYQLVTIRPVESTDDGVLHVPLGVASTEMNPPIIRTRAESQGLNAILPAPGSPNMILYSNNGTSVDYTIFKNGVWSKSNELPLDNGVSLDTGLEALRKTAATDR